jgi:hypothetical protein
MQVKAGHIILFTEGRESMDMALDYFRRESNNQEAIIKGHGGCYD